MPEKPGERRETKLLVLMLDAGDALLLREWAEAGELPTIRRLFREGLSLDLEDQPTLWSSSVFPSLLTGLSASRHGSWTYSRFDPATYTSVLDREDGYVTLPFWETLAAAGRRVAVLDIPMAPLAANLGSGLQLRSWGTHEGGRPIASFPPPFAAEVLARFGADPVGQCDRLQRGQRDFAAFRDRLIQRARARRALISHVLDQGPWDLVLASFSELHCAGHQAWHLHDPAHPAHDAVLTGKIGDPVLAVYREVDRQIGQLVDHVGPNTRVVIVATHGMGPSFGAQFSVDRVLEALEGRRSQSSRTLRGLIRVWRRLPAAVRRFLRPLGKRARQQLDSAGRKSRRSFELGTHCGYGGIRINLEGREAAGLVAQRDFEAYRESLRGAFQDLIDPETGQRLVERVWNLSDHYDWAQDSRLPDLVVEWARDLPARRAESPTLGKVDLRVPAFTPHRTGDHRPHGGLILATGGGTPSGELRHRARAEDLAPTLLAALGVQPRDLDGSAIAELATPLSEGTLSR
jgi:predicted AlkP superfamily phosphohydrolase/phosphomutase